MPLDTVSRAKPGVVTWSERYSVGIVEIDAQHQKWIEMINELYNAMKQGRGRTVLEHLLQDMDSYAKFHLAFEEGVLRMHAYADIAQHKVEHLRMTQQIQALQREFRSNKEILPADMLMILQDWLLKHILQTDKKYSDHLRSSGAR